MVGRYCDVTIIPKNICPTLVKFEINGISCSPLRATCRVTTWIWTWVGEAWWLMLEFKACWEGTTFRWSEPQQQQQDKSDQATDDASFVLHLVGSLGFPILKAFA